MGVRKWRGRIWAARLGLLALALNALVPVHLVFDLAEVFGPTQLCGAHLKVDDAERRLWTLLGGHRDEGGTPDEHGRHHACPVCSALGSLAGLAPPASTALLLPPPVGLPVALFVIHAGRIGGPTAYRSRAPPVA
jgi:hypothetical protein